MPIQVVTIGIETHLAAGATVRVDHRREFEHRLLTQFTRARIVRRDETQRSFHHVGSAGFPGMLPRLQPERFFSVIRFVETRHGHELQVAPQRRLPDDFNPDALDSIHLIQ